MFQVEHTLRHGLNVGDGQLREFFQVAVVVVCRQVMGIDFDQLVCHVMVIGESAQQFPSLLVHCQFQFSLAWPLCAETVDDEPDQFQRRVEVSGFDIPIDEQEAASLMLREVRLNTVGQRSPISQLGNQL
ncbi:hypothetical protein D3C71_1599890 [compost metagenome]